MRYAIESFGWMMFFLVMFGIILKQMGIHDDPEY